MTDLHCHILPSIDDGAQSVDASIKMLQQEKKQGVKNIVFTPHFYCNQMDAEDFIARRKQALAKLKKESKKHEELKGIKIKMGAEVAFSPKLKELDLKELCIARTNYLLLELPFVREPDSLEDVIDYIINQGITPIIAHVERYEYLMANPLKIYDLVTKGCLIEASTSALINSNTTILKLIECDLVHVISTDAHSETKRPVNIETLKKEKLQKNADLIYKGEPIEVNPIPLKKIKRAKEKNKDKTETFGDQSETTKSIGKATKTVVKVLIVLLIALFLYYMISGIVILKQAKSLKADVKEVVSQVKMMDVESAKTTWNSAITMDTKLSKRLSNPMWETVSYIPYFGQDIKSARTLTTLLKEASSEVVEPAFETLETYPLDALKLEEGFNATLIGEYLNIACDALDLIDKNEEDLSSIKFNFVKLNIGKYQDVLDIAKDNSDDLKMFKSMFDDGDKLYIIAAQNSAEIRASGGFPGSIGTIKIEDGILTVGDFNPINDVIAFLNPSSVWATSEERDLFSAWIDYPRDQCYNPNFEAVGHNWCVSYEAQTGDAADGVIAMTPIIIQKILALTNETIILSDGTELNGENATKVLQHDIYFDYFNSYRGMSVANNAVDALFGETASEALGLLTEKLSLELIPNCLNIYNEGVSDRTIMFWFEDEDTEQLARDAKCSGSLGAGVFFSMSTSSKLGWFFDMDTSVKNLGNDKYKVTVTLGNSITGTEIMESSTYIIGDASGTLHGFLHLFAPKGGRISDVEASDNTRFIDSTYKDFDVTYTHNIVLTPGETVTITYVITSEEPFDLLTTPTLKDYK